MKREKRKENRGISVLRKQLVISLIFIGIVFPLAAQNRGSDEGGGAVETVDARTNVTRRGKQWAVFIAIDEYREMSPLLYPVKDAKEIKNILLDHYYIDEIRELYNKEATGSAIRGLFVELQKKTEPNDSVFVFHAGHGITEEKTKTSAWIPYDGGKNTLAQENWLSHAQIRSLLDSLNAKHVFLISDSCYSGDLLAAKRGAPETIVSYPAAYDKVSRQAMSSGASEEVADESEFASRLKNLLLRTETPYLTPLFLCSQIIEAQTAKQLSTIPILAVIPQSSHVVGGNFLFFRKNPAVAQPVPAQGTTPAAAPEYPTAAVQPGEIGYFVGSWIADVEYNGSFDTYEINFSVNGRCKVKIINDKAQQEANGNWSWDGTYFKVNATFRNPAIAYQRSIQWVSVVSFSGDNSFNILGKAATNGSAVRFTFFRE